MARLFTGDSSQLERQSAAASSISFASLDLEWRSWNVALPRPLGCHSISWETGVAHQRTCLAAGLAACVRARGPKRFSAAIQNISASCSVHGNYIGVDVTNSTGCGPQKGQLRGHG